MLENYVNKKSEGEELIKKLQSRKELNKNVKHELKALTALLPNTL